MKERIVEKFEEGLPGGGALIIYRMLVELDKFEIDGVTFGVSVERPEDSIGFDEIDDALVRVKAEPLSREEKESLVISLSVNQPKLGISAVETVDGERQYFTSIENFRSLLEYNQPSKGIKAERWFLIHKQSDRLFNEKLESLPCHIELEDRVETKDDILDECALPEGCFWVEDIASKVYEMNPDWTQKRIRNVFLRNLHEGVKTRHGGAYGFVSALDADEKIVRQMFLTPEGIELFESQDSFITSMRNMGDTTLKVINEAIGVLRSEDLED